MAQYGKGQGIIDFTTGETIPFTETVTCRTESEIEKQKEIIEKRQQIKAEFVERGLFLWQIYQLSETYAKDLSASMITRLVYLSTYLGYNGYLVYDIGAKVEEDDTKLEKLPLTKNQMKFYLNISYTDFRDFIKEVQEKEILYCKDDKWYMTPRLFRRGKIPEKEIALMAENKKYVTRLYRNAIRDIYKRATPKSHKSLSYIFQILPFVNRQYNIVCFNPLETKLNKIDNMNLGQFCEAIGYNASNSTRLFKALFEPKFYTDDGRTTPVIRFVATDCKNKKTNSIFINPQIYYAGDRWEEVKVLGKF